jgi:uncharacterized membrane protein
MAGLVETQSLGLTAVAGVPRAAERPRLDSVDRLRGLVMVIMALDHVRAFFAPPFPDPVDIDNTYAALFFTRWITHYCAPTFVFLAGAGAYLAGWRGKTKPQLAWFLLTRGLWIVLLELTWVRWSWTFKFDNNFGVGVLWAIGWSMVVLAALVWLPTWLVTAFGVVMIAGHNYLDRFPASDFGPLADLWQVLHRKEMGLQQPLEWFGGQIRFTPGYPLIPWIGVMAVGYGFGALLVSRTVDRRKWMVGLGAAACVGFVALRWLNVYGDPDPWSPRGDPLFTVMSFLNCHKYPPSLLYLLMTLGPALLVLALLERTPELPGQPLLVFGRVPMFYYLTHLPLIHGLADAAALYVYGRPVLEQAPPLPEGYGYSLPVIYAVWLGVLLILYPPCRWFMGVKQRSRAAWLSYF